MSAKQRALTAIAIAVLGVGVAFALAFGAHYLVDRPAMAAERAEASQELVGRYQITATSYIDGSGFGNKYVVLVFKVDTVTGKVWNHEHSKGGWSEVK